MSSGDLRGDVPSPVASLLHRRVRYSSIAAASHPEECLGEAAEMGLHALCRNIRIAENERRSGIPGREHSWTVDSFAARSSTTARWASRSSRPPSSQASALSPLSEQSMRARPVRSSSTCSSKLESGRSCAACSCLKLRPEWQLVQWFGQFACRRA